MIKLRWLILCDKNGNKTEPELQYRVIIEGYNAGWRSVPIEEMKTWEDDTSK